MVVCWQLGIGYGVGILGNGGWCTGPCEPVRMASPWSYTVWYWSSHTDVATDLTLWEYYALLLGKHQVFLISNFRRVLSVVCRGITQKKAYSKHQVLTKQLWTIYQLRWHHIQRTLIFFFFISTPHPHPFEWREKCIRQPAMKRHVTLPPRPTVF